MKNTMIITALLFASMAVQAQENKKKDKGDPDRQQMAKAHQQMSQCLESDKSMQECRQQMHQACASSGSNCMTMMHMGEMHGEGGMHGQGEMMQSQEEMHNQGGMHGQSGKHDKGMMPEGKRKKE